MARISNNLALAPCGNLLNLWYVVGPIKVANPNYNDFADTEDENYEPEFLHVEECLEIIPHEGNKPVQNTLVTDKKFIQILTSGMVNAQLVSYIDSHTDGMPLQLLMEKLRNTDDTDFARENMAKRAPPVLSGPLRQRRRVGMVSGGRGRGTQPRGRSYGAKGKGKGKGRIPGGIPVACPPGVCWQHYRAAGSCTRPNCRFSHDVTGAGTPAPGTNGHSLAAVRAIMDSLSDADRAVVLAPAGSQGNAPQYGGFAIVMNVALAIHILFAQAMLNPILSLFNIAFPATKTNSNFGTAMVNTAVYGHSKEEPSILRTLVDTGACCTLIILSIFADLTKCTPASATYKMYGNSSITVSVADDTSMTVLGHVAFTLNLSKTHHLVIHAGIVAKLATGIDFLFGMPSSSLRSLGTVIDTRHSWTTHHMALFDFMKLG